MALTPINPVSRQPRKDVADHILQALQLTGAGLQIPVAIEQLRKASGERQQLSDAREGKYTVDQAAKAGLSFRPKLTPPQASLLPTPAQPNQMMAPDIEGGAMEMPQAPKQRFSKLPSYPGKLYGPDGNLMEGEFVDQNAEKEQMDQVERLRGDYGKENTVQVLEQMQQNYRNVIDSFGQGGKEGDILGMMNLMKLFNPNVSRGADGSILDQGDSIPEIIKKKFAALIGGQNTVLLPEERRVFMSMAPKAIENYQQALSQTNERYKGLAERGGFLEEDIGIRDYGNLLKEMPQAPSRAPREPAPQQKVSGQDLQAIEWARQNPNDPRAKKILQLNGAR